MSKNTVIILGDSTSMSIGIERHMYPFLMADEGYWPESTEIVNCSQPGITSADACAFLFEQLPKLPRVRAVIAYLGTCDAASWEIYKGPYTPFRHSMNKWRNRLGVPPKKSRLKNRLLHFEWNNEWDYGIEKPESPADYEFNLNRIVTACQKRRIPVVLVRAKSNPLFPPGVGKGNFIFYSYLGIEDRISDRLSIADERFKAALSLYERGEFLKAGESYKQILLSPGVLTSNAEYPLVVTNNYAVSIAKEWRFREAEHLFRMLLKEASVREEIILYNLAQLFNKEGNAASCSEFLKASYEADLSLYRIRAPYLEALDRVAEKYDSGISVLDLQNLIADECYVDHCHPLLEGQSQIASQILGLLKSLGITGTSKAEIRNVLHNPEHSLGNQMEFYAYFRTYSSWTPEHIKQERKQLGERLAAGEREEAALEASPEELSRAVRYYLRHPCFPTLGSALKFGPEYPSDIGRFPEFFLFRHVIPYLKAHESHERLRNRFSPEVKILRESSALRGALPSLVVPLISGEDPIKGNFDEAFESARLIEILNSVREALSIHLRSGQQVYERIKTTIFWYFRETLRFGSHSRVSMRYDRVSLEYMAEALAVAGVIDLRLGGEKEQEIRELIRMLEDAVRIHESFCRKFSLNKNSQTLLGEYDGELRALSESLENEDGVKIVHSRNISLLSR